VSLILLNNTLWCHQAALDVGGQDYSYVENVLSSVEDFDIVGLLLFKGVVRKSAQLGLHT